MSPAATSLVQLLAAGGYVEPATPHIRSMVAELWDAGLLNIWLPGERYKLNAAGLALAQKAPAP